MGYSIYIGNIEMELIDGDDEWTTEHSRIINGVTRYYYPRVNEIHQDDAPVFPNDEMTNNGNDRHPSYSGWGDFCRDSGLYTLFFNDTYGLMREHPGCFPLKKWHLGEIELALKAWRESHPDAIAGFEKWSWNEEVEEVGYDPILARLIWLEYWVKWALTFCENPGIYNS